jgi:hypothetical protein
MSDLHAELLLAHKRDDKAALVELYSQAALETDDVDAKGFFLTHAYVFALETGHPNASGLRSQLAQMGRETA